MGNYPHRGYDYSRPGVMMVTLRAHPAVRFCTITQTSFYPSPLSRIVGDALMHMTQRHDGLKIACWQIMPDHLHFILATVRPLPPGDHALACVEEFIADATAAARAAHRIPPEVDALFKGPINHSIAFTPERKERQLAYVRDNVRRYRVKLRFPDLFLRAAELRHPGIPPDWRLWRLGNGFLLDHYETVYVQISRRVTSGQLTFFTREALDAAARGAVFVGAFLSPGEKRIKECAIEQGCSVIQVVTDEITPRWKPAGRDFELCAQGRLLVVSAFNAITGLRKNLFKITREQCLRLNEVARCVADAGRQYGGWIGGTDAGGLKED